MPMAAFDTLGVARRLQEEFGMPDKQAEGVAVVLHDNFVGNVATKDDLARTEQKLGAEITRVEDKLTAKIDHVEETLTGKIDGLDTKIDHVEETLTDKIEALEERVILKMTVRLGGIIVAILAFFEILNRVFPIGGG